MIPTYPLLDDLMDRTRGRLRGRPGAGGGGGGFLPTDLPGLGLWLDGGDAGSITDSGGGSVSQWDDKSGLGNNVLQGNVSRQPLTGQDNQNGLNGIKFDGSDDRMFRNGFNELIEEWFLVYKINGTPSANGGLLSNTHDKGNIRFDQIPRKCRYFNTDVIAGAPGDTNDFGSTDGQYNPDGITGTVLADLDVVEDVARRFHTTRGSGIADAANVYNDLGIGADIMHNRHLACTVYEIFGSTSVLTAQQRTDARDYLASRWAVT